MLSVKRSKCLGCVGHMEVTGHLDEGLSISCTNTTKYSSKTSYNVVETTCQALSYHHKKNRMFLERLGKFPIILIRRKLIRKPREQSFFQLFNAHGLENLVFIYSVFQISRSSRRSRSSEQTRSKHRSQLFQ